MMSTTLYNSMIELTLMFVYNDRFDSKQYQIVLLTTEKDVNIIRDDK